MAKRYYVTVLSEYMAYGGPEEGGWYFDTAHPVRPGRLCQPWKLT